MFKFAKKNVEIEEQVLEDVSDEQLSEVTGGSLLDTVDLNKTVGSISHIGAQMVQPVVAIGAPISAPVSTGDILSTSTGTVLPTSTGSVLP